jgi:molybdate-binding protein/DNA-binding XRE family transcriptional regulator
MTSLANEVGRFRRERGLTQQELASRIGVSRAEVSAIENGRGAPSTATALELAAALGRTVEELFSLSGPSPAWAWEPRGSCRFWQARVGSRTLLYPVEPTSLGLVPHDGVHREGPVPWADSSEPTLVVAGCDPAVGLLARELLVGQGIRVVALTRSSRDALDLLRRGLVHAAGLHWSEDSRSDANAAMVQSTLGRGYRLLHLARWQEGIALGPLVRTRSIGALRRTRLRWVAREEGSGARRCLDRLLGARRFRHVARDHQSVASAIRSGFADAGVAVRLVAEDAGLSFLPLQAEDYELCYPETLQQDHALRALGRALSSDGLRRRFGELPGYDVRRMGEERPVSRD